MTKILKHLSDDKLAVNLLWQGWGRPLRSEINQLGLKNPRGLEREVVLQCLGKPWMYARTFIPESLVKAQGVVFSGLGERSLGDVLFRMPGLRRSAFSVACLRPGHQEYQAAAQALQQTPGYFWARRSQFYLPGGAMALLEIFSPLMEHAIVRQKTR